MSEPDPRAITLSEDCLNRLFFSSKNLAIESGMRRIADFLRERGLPNASVRWMEDSLSARIDITVPVKRRKKPYELRIGLKRERLDDDIRPFRFCKMAYQVEDSYSCGPSTSSPSSLNGIMRTEGYDFVRTVVAGCNYPFRYESFSPF